MTNKAAMLTLRLEPALKTALDDKARQRRMATGGNVTLADLVREALGQYLAEPSPSGAILKPEDWQDDGTWTNTATPAPADTEPRYKAIRADAVRLKAEGMTQREIAKLLGVSQPTVFKALKG